jgi:FMN-dependent NADH-azoreductase
MSRILLITSSPRTESYSTRVARALAEKLSAKPGSTVVVRDLTREPLPHIDDTFAVARNTPAEHLTASQKAALRFSDELLKELNVADTLIIAAGMINFGIPSTLKAYIDYILRPGVAFRYTDKGPEGLVKGKKAYLVLARGGNYSAAPMRAFNFQDPYLRAALGLIGITDIEVIPVEGVACGPAAAENAVSAALGQVAALAA